MSAAEAVLRVLEEIRQTALTRRLGQVECPGTHLNASMHDFWITRGYPCPSCKAAL